jgi:hypothetical protein
VIGMKVLVLLIVYSKNCDSKSIENSESNEDQKNNVNKILMHWQ